MVELRLDAQDLSLNKDMYVAVRVGDVQKLSKVGASKSYKFPPNAAKGRRYGKIELFRRVGSSSISIDQENTANIQNVTILDKESPFSFQVHLANGVVIEKPTKKDEDSNPKVAAAKMYLDKHHLELRLAEAMQSVLRERPDDPAAFVAAKLQANAGMVQISPKAAEAAPAPEEEVVMPPAPDKTSAPTSPGFWLAACPSQAWNATYVLARTEVRAKQAVLPDQALAEQQLAPIVPPKRSDVAQAKSGSPAEVPIPNKASVTTSRQNEVRAETAPTPNKPSAPSVSSDFWFAASPSQAWSAMHVHASPAIKKVPAPDKAQAPTSGLSDFWSSASPPQAWNAMQVQASAPASGRNLLHNEQAVVPKAEGWQQLASVGTWCSPRLFRGEASATVETSTPHVEVQKPKQSFQQLASVGTWCAPLLFRQEASTDNEAPSGKAESSGNKASATTSPASAVIEGSNSNSDFVMRPSVGTWCVPLMQHVASEAIAVELPASPSHLSPSVGTWLMHVPTPGKESGNAPTGTRKPLHMIPMSLRYGAAFHSCGVRPSMCCL